MTEPHRNLVMRIIEKFVGTTRSGRAAPERAN